jgi:asparagine synthase (glutamine-hydrolysing)
MCGICGFFEMNHHNDKLYRQKTISEMTNTLIHRGPDDFGYWHHPENGLSLGHRRLSIVDLSSHGHQPMKSKSGQFMLVFNGEIYNHISLRKEISNLNTKILWRGHSDTETLLACIEIWGVEKTIQKCSGMFAIAIYDNKENTIYLVRDRMGEKPLYYGFQNGNFLFASELKAILKHPDFIPDIDRNALSLMFNYSYIPAPFSIYKDIKKLQPGTILKVDLKKINLKKEVFSEPSPYWSLKDISINAKKKMYSGTPEEAILHLDELLNQSVNEQMVADVPVGAFLSGGIDSSLITSLMQSQSSKPIDTFTIGFSEDAFNEAIYAKKISKHLGTNHTELYVSSQDAINLIEKLPQIYDEPFSDSSQIPAYLVSKMTRKNVSVSLSGDAGDELFGGYNRYIWTKKIWNRIKHIPMPLRKFISNCLISIPPSAWDMFLKFFLDVSMPGDKIHKTANVFNAKSIEGFYFNLIAHWNNSNNIVVGQHNIIAPVMQKRNLLNLGSIEQNMMYLDSISYLPDDILTKVDRAAMSVSLETRVPFLNHHIVEFANHLPLSMKIKNGESKWILRKLLDKHIPRELVDRPKMGFGVPIDIWLRGPLREWAEALLDESRIKQEGFLHYEPIRKKFDEHLSGKRNWQHLLWDILIFQSWLEKNH